MITNTRALTIEWGDCDAAGIVFYPRYFAMFDWSTATLFAHVLGMKKPQMLARYGIVGIPMVDTRGKFHTPSSYGDDVTIESRIEKFGRSSFDVHHRLMRGDQLGVEGWETRVWVGKHPDDPRRIKAVPIPAEIIETFGFKAP